jgi:penicillin amidase
LPVEFQVLGVKPERWTEIDSLAWIKVFALSLSGNMWREISNSIAGQYLNPRQMADLLNVHPNSADESHRVTAANAASMNRLRDLEGQLESVLRLGGPYVGSNAWVVSGKLTKSGQGILANDAHLQLQIPSAWYVAALRGDRIDVAGVTLVGLPIVIFGRNPDIAWGGTAMRADNEDLYLEQPNATDPTRYRVGDGWESFQTHVESIKVRAEFPAWLRNPRAPSKVRVRATRHGPVISDAIPGLDQPIALEWAALQPHDTTYEAFYRLNYAHDWSSFKDAASYEVAPPLNLLYLDRHDNIGLLGAGRIPIRAKGHGQFPVPGWNDEYHWNGYVPSEKMPQRYNPPSGYIASANDNATDADYPYFISNDWAPPERVQRIRQLVEAGSAGEARLSLADMERIQHDERDLGAARLARYLVQTIAIAPTEDTLRGQALARLAAWNGEMAADSPAAAVFMVWARHLRERLFDDAISTYSNQPAQATELKSIAAGATNDQLLQALQDSAAGWCSADTRSPRSCRELLRRSLEDALDELRRLRGSNVGSWAWGRLHDTVYRHRPFSSIASLAALFERRIPNGGSPDAVNLATATYRESSGYEQDFGPSFRQIVQVSNGDWKHVYVNSTGQSGNPLSRHYDDMVKPFHDGQYFTLTTASGDTARTITTITPR